MNTLKNPNIPRTADEGRDAATQLLLTEKKASGAQRRAWKRQRDLVIEYPTTEPTRFFDRMLRKILSYSWVRLLRENHRAIRREREAANILSKMDPTSNFAKPLRVSQATNKAIALMTKDEIDRRSSLDRPRGDEPNNDNNVTGPTA